MICESWRPEQLLKAVLLHPGHTLQLAGKLKADSGTQALLGLRKSQPLGVNLGMGHF